MRLFHRVYAWASGHFWMPCPICKKKFGGHEIKHYPRSAWVTKDKRQVVCPRCTHKAVYGESPEALLEKLFRRK